METFQNKLFDLQISNDECKSYIQNHIDTILSLENETERNKIIYSFIDSEMDLIEKSKRIEILKEYHLLTHPSLFQLFLKLGYSQNWIFDLTFYGMPKDIHLTHLVAFQGNFQFLEYFVNQGFPFDKNTLLYAIYSLDISCVHFLIQKDCEYTIDFWSVLYKLFLLKNNSDIKKEKIKNMMIYGVQLYKLNPEKYQLPDNLKTVLLQISETSSQQEQNEDHSDEQKDEQKEEQKEEQNKEQNNIIS